MLFKIPVTLLAFEAVVAVFGQAFAERHYTPIRLVSI
jgi:hypothetical protein